MRSYERMRRRSRDVKVAIMNDPQKKRKLLHIVTRLNIGGPAIHAVLLIRGLADCGYETTLVSGACEAADGDMSYLLEPGDRVHWMPEMSRSVVPLDNLRALVRLWRLIRSVRPDIVHTHTAMAGCLGRVAAFLAGVPVIVHTFHGNSLRGYFSPLESAVFLRVERLLARFTDAICVLSEQQLRELSGDFAVASRSSFRVIRLGFDLSPFTTIPAPSCHQGRLRVGWFGRLVPIKNVPLLLRIVQATVARTEDIEFHIAGDGPERPSVVEAVKRHGSRLIWHGWQRDITPLIKTCDVLLQTSHNEGTPVALIQGMAAARPFVSTAVGGVVDMVSGLAVRGPDGCVWYSNGVLADPDPLAFVRALMHLSANPACLAEMGTEARTFATAQYKRDTLLKTLDSLYSDLLRKKLPPKHLLGVPS